MWLRNVLGLAVIVNIFVPIKTQWITESFNFETDSNSMYVSPSDSTDNSQSVGDEQGSSSTESSNTEDGNNTIHESPSDSTDNYESVGDEQGSSASESSNTEDGNNTIHETPTDSTDNYESVGDEQGSSSSESSNTEDGNNTIHETPTDSTDNSESARDEQGSSSSETANDESSISDNYITYIPIPTNDPSSSLSSDNETSSGEIPLERPTESVPDSYGNNIPTNPPTLGNNPSISDSDGDGVNDANGQGDTEPDEFIGGQTTASYNGDITTISNDPSNNVTSATENDTQELVTDGGEQFSTSGSESIQLSDEEAIESGVDIHVFNVSSDMQSETNPITRGTCGLPEGGPMIQQALPPVTTASRSLIWSTEDKALYFVDVYKPAVSKYTPANGRLVTLNLDGLVVKTILPTSTKHQFVVALDDRLVLLENSFTKDKNVTAYKKVLAQFNSIYDLGVAKTDLQGRIWIPVRVNVSNDKIITKLYLISGGKAEYRDTFRRNYGMAWSADNKYFYIADSESGIGYIYVYDFQRKDGSIKNRRILFNQNNYPKLSAQISDIVVDKNGNIWASIFENNLVIKIDHVSGNILEMIALPTKYPSCLAFGTVKQDKLFVGTTYTSSGEMDIPYTYVISKLEAKGISATKEVQVKKVFGSTTINIFASNGDQQTPPSDTTPTDSSMNEICPINKTLLEIRDRNAGECTVVKNKPIVQEAIAPLETTAKGLHWDFRTNAMYLADEYVPALVKYTPHNGKTVTVKFENTTTITAIVPIKNKDHNYIISAGHSLVRFENKFKENTVQELNGEVIATLRGKDTNLIFSRGRTDSQGRLWIGTRFIQPSRSKGTLYMLQKGKLISKISRVVDSGGMTWSLGKRNFYFADAGEGIIYSYDYNPWSGAIRNRQIFFDMNAEANMNGTVTDIIIDNKDNIWAAVYGGSMVICISRKTGSVMQTISVPIKYPVSLEFGGVKRDTLFVSGALRDTCKIEAMPYTYAISNTGVRGTNANYYYTL